MEPGSEDPTPEALAGRPAVKSLAGMVMSGALWLTGGRAVRIITTVATLAILARLISPAEFGVVAAAGLADTFVLAIMDYWLGIALLRPKELEKPAIQSQVWASLLVAAALALVTFTVAPFIERALDFPGLARAMMALTPLYFAHAVIAASTALLQRQYRFRTAATVTILTRLLGYSLPAIVLAFMGWGLWAIIWGQLISLIVTAAVLAGYARLPLGWPKRLAFGKLGFSGASGGLYGLISSLQVNVDTLAVAALLGPSVTGLYTRAYNISVQAKDPFVSLQLTVRQALAAIQDEPRRAQEGLIRALRLSGIGGFILTAFVFAAAKPITGVLLGAQWLAAAPLLAVLFLGFPARVMLLMLDAASMALGQIWPLVWRQLALLVLIAVAAFAVAANGAVWVAVVVTAAFWLGLLVSAFMVAGRTKIAVWRILATMLPGLGIGVALALVLMLALYYTPDGALLKTAVAAAITAVASLIVGVLLPEAWLGGFLARLRGRMLGRPATQ